MVLAAISVRVAVAQSAIGPMGEQFSVRVVASKLGDPWTLIYGPDGYLWITEGNGYQVSRLNPATGEKTVLLDLNRERQFPRYDKMPDSVSGGKPWPPHGLMGMALHPGLLKGSPYVFLSYIYRFAGASSNGNGCAVNYGGCVFTTRLVRYEYDEKRHMLLRPVILCDTIPASNDHNGGRMLIAPVNGKDYIFYTVGDMGAGQFNNGGRPNHAQQINSYEGKVLRFNVEPDGDANAADAWIPNDNPFNTDSRQSAVWSIGHRNPQGLDYAVIAGNGHLYSSEHGPYSDDEINIIERGKNYGHPLVIGYADGNYDGLAAGVSNHDSLPGKWHTTYPLITSEKAAAQQIGDTVYRDPLKTLYPNSASFLQALFAQVNSGKKGSSWPSEAPSSIAVYTSSSIPGWQNSLLIPTLKGGKLVRLKLNEAGNKVVGDTINYFKGQERYRAIALAPEGNKIYLAVDSSNVTSGPSAQKPQHITCGGCIIEFTYQGTDRGTH